MKIQMSNQANSSSAGAESPSSPRYHSARSYNHTSFHENNFFIRYLRTRRSFQIFVCLVYIVLFSLVHLSSKNPRNGQHQQRNVYDDEDDEPIRNVLTQKQQPLRTVNFVKEFPNFEFSDSEVKNSVIGEERIVKAPIFYKEIVYPLFSIIPKDDEPKMTKNPVSISDYKSTGNITSSASNEKFEVNFGPKLLLNILKEQPDVASLISILPITKFSNYPLPKTENNLFENIVADQGTSKNGNKYLEELRNICETSKGFHEFVYPRRVYLDNSSKKLKWMFCRKEFLETKKTNSLTDLHPCADFMFVAKFKNVFISRNTCEEYCMSMFTINTKNLSRNKYFNFQPWFKIPNSKNYNFLPKFGTDLGGSNSNQRGGFFNFFKSNAIDERKFNPKHVYQVENIGTIEKNLPKDTIVIEKAGYTFVSPYLDAFGHFSSETLYYIVYLLQVLPKDVKILACQANICKQYFQYLAELPGDPFNLNLNDPDVSKRRIIPLTPNTNSYLVKEIYLPSSFPNCQDEATKIYSRESILLTQQVFLKPFYHEQKKTQKKRHILVIDRSDATMRTISNHQDMVAALREKFPNDEIVEFLSSAPQFKKSLKNVISAFFYAKLVIAPHGAGLTHLLWCQPGTRVIEIGFEQGAHPFPSTYYGLAVAGNLDYYLVLGQGTLLGKWMTAPVPSIIKLSERAIQEFDRTSSNSMQLQNLNENLRNEVTTSFQNFIAKYSIYFLNGKSNKNNQVLFKEFLSKMTLGMPRLPNSKGNLIQNFEKSKQKLVIDHYLMDVNSFFDPKKTDYKKVFLLKQICLGMIKSEIGEKIKILENYMFKGLTPALFGQNNVKTFLKNFNNSYKNTLFLTLISKDHEYVIEWLTKDWKYYFADTFNKIQTLRTRISNMNQNTDNNRETLYYFDKVFSLESIVDKLTPLSSENRVRIYIQNSPPTDMDFLMRNIQTRDAHYLNLNFGKNFGKVKYTIMHFNTLASEGNIFSSNYLSRNILNGKRNFFEHVSFVFDDLTSEEEKFKLNFARESFLAHSSTIVVFSKRVAEKLAKIYGKRIMYNPRTHPKLSGQSKIVQIQREPFTTVFEPPIYGPEAVSEEIIKRNFEIMRNFLPNPFFLSANSKSAHKWEKFDAAFLQMKIEDNQNPVQFAILNSYLGQLSNYKKVVPILNHHELNLLFSMSLGLIDLGNPTEKKVSRINDPSEIPFSVMECLTSGNPVILTDQFKDNLFFTQLNQQASSKKNSLKGIYFVDRDNQKEIKEALEKVQKLTPQERKEIKKELSDMMKKSNLYFTNMIHKMFSELHRRRK